MKRVPPARRGGYTVEAIVGNQKVFLRTGEYEDGALCEIFIDVPHQGSFMREILDAFAITISIGLQNGVPLEEYVDKFLFSKFEPRGMVQRHPFIKMADSILDFVFRELAISYLGKKDLAHVEEKNETS